MTTNTASNELKERNPQLPAPTEIADILQEYGVGYRYNLLCKADEFQIDGEWTMDDGHARAVAREGGETHVVFQWQDALELLRGWPDHRWHPWQHITEPAVNKSASDIDWLVYAAIQNTMSKTPPIQPIFVITPQPMGTITPPNMIAYEYAIFHHVPPGNGDGGRPRTAASAAKSGKVAVMQTRRIAEYDDDERFFVIGDVDVSKQSTIWDDMYALWLVNPYLIAIPGADDTEGVDLPTVDEIYRDIEAQYLETREPFSVYSIMAETYWPDIPADVSDRILRTKYGQTIKQGNGIPQDDWIHQVGSE